MRRDKYLFTNVTLLVRKITYRLPKFYFLKFPKAQVYLTALLTSKARELPLLYNLLFTATAKIIKTISWEKFSGTEVQRKREPTSSTACQAVVPMTRHLRIMKSRKMLYSYPISSDRLNYIASYNIIVSNVSETSRPPTLSHTIIFPRPSYNPNILLGHYHGLRGGENAS